VKFRIGPSWVGNPVSFKAARRDHDHGLAKSEHEIVGSPAVEVRE